MSTKPYVENAAVPHLPCSQPYEENLPSEIICSEILPRLPAKSLVRFRCVCKSWLELLTTNPLFQSIHLKHHPHNTHLLVDVCDFGLPFTLAKHYFLSVKASQEGSTPLQVTDCVQFPKNFMYQYCANGLLLGFYQYGGGIAIFNPFTRKSTSIPSPPSPSTSSILYRSTQYLGFSPRTNEYKIILAEKDYAAQAHYPMLFVLKVFTLGTGLWRTLEVDWHALSLDPLKSAWKFVTGNGNGLCVRGAVHWLAEDGNCILALDVADERFTVIPLPVEAEPYVLRRDCYKIIEVGGCLGLLYTRNDQKVLWILKDYVVWVKEAIHSVPSRDQNDETIHTGEILLDSSRRGSDHLHFYDMKTRSYRRSRIMMPEFILKPSIRPISTSFSPCTVLLT